VAPERKKTTTATHVLVRLVWRVIVVSEIAVAVITLVQGSQGKATERFLKRVVSDAVDRVTVVMVGKSVRIGSAPSTVDVHKTQNSIKQRVNTYVLVSSVLRTSVVSVTRVVPRTSVLVVNKCVLVLNVHFVRRRRVVCLNVVCRMHHALATRVLLDRHRDCSWTRSSVHQLNVR
jgi:hypothetical protein